MAHPEKPDNPDQEHSNLPKRAARYKQEVEKVVREIGEHPFYELKRSCSLKVLKDRIEFVKDIQSIATSRIDTEKFLVIGADAGSKSFAAVQNVNEFDEAAIRQLLEKYLNPVPEFELFHLTSSDGHLFVLVVIPKQKHRKILARVTVDDPSDSKPRILIREGDLWTKGASTGKRLAKPEGWDEIYEETVESEAERRTRQRTAHALDLAIAREKIQPVGGVSTFPSYFTDEGFQALMEDLCSTQNEAKFKVLLERLRDDLVEGWHKIGGYEQGFHLVVNDVDAIPLSKEKIHDHNKNIFRPAMHWLTLAGIYVVKNSGPIPFLDAVADLLKEVFETSHRLLGLRMFVPNRATVTSVEDHVSYSVPALESLVSLHLIGAYVTKRTRFEYLSGLFRADVYSTVLHAAADQKKLPMAFWPFGTGQGEPDEIRFRAGRINFCAARVKTDSAYLKIFGSVAAATEAICQYEFCLELNSYMAFPGEGTNESAAYLAKMNPEMSFYFWPSFIAFPLKHVYSLASALFSEIKKGKRQLLKEIFFDESLASFIAKPGGDLAFLRFLDGLAQEQVGLFMEQRRFPPMLFWPKEIDSGLKEFRQRKNKPTTP
jgi:hypothetical protein